MDSVQRVNYFLNDPQLEVFAPPKEQKPVDLALNYVRKLGVALITGAALASSMVPAQDALAASRVIVFVRPRPVVHTPPAAHAQGEAIARTKSQSSGSTPVFVHTPIDTSEDDLQNMEAARAEIGKRIAATVHAFKSLFTTQKSFSPIVSQEVGKSVETKPHSKSLQQHHKGKATKTPVVRDEDSPSPDM